jgi:hypothetical protein
MNLNASVSTSMIKGSQAFLGKYCFLTSSFGHKAVKARTESPKVVYFKDGCINIILTVLDDTRHCLRGNEKNPRKDIVKIP